MAEFVSEARLRRMVGLTNASSALRKGQEYFSARILLESGERRLLLTVVQGKILYTKRDALWTDGLDFALRGTEDQWDSFLRREPLHGDLFACLRRGFLRLEGNVELAMSNITSFLSLLELLRSRAERRPA